MKRIIFAAAVVATTWLVGCDSGTPTTPQPNPPAGTNPPAAPAKRLLVVTHTAGFRHGSIPVAETTLRDLAPDLYQAEFCRTAADVAQMLVPPALARFDAVFFANTTGNLGIPDVGAFLNWIAGGGGFLGAHSASDTYHESPEFLAMLGGEFEAHGSIVETEVRVDEPANAIVAHLAPRFRITDELYRFARFDRTRVTLLLSLDRNPADGVGEAGRAAELPMAWQRTHGSGRVFYTAFGHRDEIWQDTRFRQHLREAIRWVMKM